MKKNLLILLATFLCVTIGFSQDSDGDGLSDADEIGLYGTDPFNPDTDGGGQGDGGEVLLYGQDPLNPTDDQVDCDSDGIVDVDEIGVFGTDPCNADTDGGGINDLPELLAGTDPLNPGDDGVACADADGDGFTDAACGGLDCDDGNPLVNPLATEIPCNGLDDDCNPGTPDDVDVDGDGFGACSGDCDDNDPNVNPSMTEICGNGIDDDCNPLTLDLNDADGDGFDCSVDCDDNDPNEFPGQVWYADCDGDGFYSSVPIVSCEMPASSPCNDLGAPDGGWSNIAGVDCDDENVNVYPGAPELCDGIDNDCNGLDDAGNPGVGGQETDDDGDGVSECQGDCDDNDPSVNPGMVEIACNGIDDDCNPLTADDMVPPTAICQPATIMLDASGVATLNAADIDAGSTDNCGGVTLSLSQQTFDCTDMYGAFTADQSLVISGVIDGPLPGGLPKAIEVYVREDIADLSLYGLGSANNGGGTNGEEFTFPVASATAGQFIYVATEAIEFTNWFGFAPDYISTSAPNINGDDAIELFYNSGVVDVFGDINVDGTGQPWEYLDGWVYRNDLTGPDGATFVLGNWTYSGINVLDGETSNGTATNPFPSNTYISSAPVSGSVPVTLFVTDNSGNVSSCVADVTVSDIIDPTASNPITINVECLADMPAPDISVVTDGDDNCSNTTVTFVSEVSDGLTCPETITRTYNVSDDSGNNIDVTQLIIIEDITDPTASNPATVNVECQADVPAPDVLIVNDEADNCSVSPIVSFVSDVSDGLSCPETITRTYSVMDDCNNQIILTQLIIVEDITSPVPDGGLLPVNSNCDVVLGAPTATDNCDGVLNASGDVTFPITAMGTTTVTWTYTDVCGNVTVQTQDVTIAPMDVTTTLVELTITANNTGQTYQWIDCFDDSQITGETSIDYTATVNGDYAVIITTADGCSDTSACVNINNVGIDNISTIEVSIYPNPTLDGSFTVEVEGGIKSIEMRDMLGRLISIPVDYESGVVDGSSLESGKYFVTIVTEKSVVTKEIVIAK